MERALQTVSGWPAVLVPFLVQNSLWFIGMFCIVAAATLLVSYTTGFWKAVSVSTSLSAGTLFLLWQGYRLRQHHPEMEAASRVFLILGVLLIPLDIATAVRLMATGQSLPWITLGGVVTAISLGGLFYATMLVSGVMDRALQGQHPRLFLALVATQLAVPLLQAFPSWPLLALTHCVVLGLLAYALVRFVHEWLHTLFVERQKGAYYAAGTLVLATPAGEHHELGILMVALCAQEQGVRPLYLGCDLAVDEICDAARRVHARAVGLGIVGLDAAAAAREVRALRRRLPRSVELWLGGAGSARLAALPLGTIAVPDLAALETRLVLLREVARLEPA